MTKKRSKKEEEARILAEMEQGLKEQGLEFPSYTGGNKKKKHRNEYDETMPEKIHCRRCGTLLENGVCPICGYTIYVPMDKKKREKRKLIVTIVCMVAFVIAFVALQIKNG